MVRFSTNEIYCDSQCTSSCVVLCSILGSEKIAITSPCSICLWEGCEPSVDEEVTSASATLFFACSFIPHPRLPRANGRIVHAIVACTQPLALLPRCVSQGFRACGRGLSNQVDARIRAFLVSRPKPFVDDPKTFKMDTTGSHRGKWTPFPASSLSRSCHVTPVPLKATTQVPDRL